MAAEVAPNVVPDVAPDGRIGRGSAGVRPIIRGAMAVRAIRWFLVLTGGVLLGAGLFLHGQVALARDIQAQVGDTFFLWRAVGRATFFLQGSEHRIALTLSEVPSDILAMSNRTAWILVWFGLGTAIAAGLLIRCGRTAGSKRRA
ncbi:MAG: hypothetical protein Fur0037_19610 [Planctomycetota bacterium]